MYQTGKRPFRRLFSSSQEGLPKASNGKFTLCCVMADQWRLSMVSHNAPRLLLVFRCGAEYVFVDNETRAMMTITLSTTAINIFRREDLAPDDLARRAAEWALLTHDPNSSVDLTVDKDLSQFCQYYFSSAALEKQAC
jgi:hypothetical protein